MPNVNQIIRETLIRYVTSPVAPQFAVMVKGKWGSGKTWLVKEVVASLIKEGRKVLYVSLYGLEKRDDIDDEIFKQLHPLLASKGAIVVGRTMKSAAKFFRFEIPEMDVSKFVSGAGEHALVFDDLERCGVPLPALLGYINVFVEHGDQRVILIANEDEVSEAVRPEYLKVREKLIGKTFEVRSDVSDALDAFSRALRPGDASDLVGRCKELVRNVYTASGYENLRNLRAALLGFDELMVSIDQKYRDSEPIVTDLLRQYLVLTFETRSGTLTAEDIGNLGQILGRVQYIKEPERTDLQRRVVAMDAKYVGIDWNNESLPYDLWGRLFVTGIVDAAAVDEALSNSRHLADGSVPSWRRLWHFFEISDDEFVANLERTLSDMAALKYTNAGVLKHVVGTLLRLHSLSLYKGTPASIFNMAAKTLDQLVAAGVFEVSVREESYGTFSNTGWEGLGYHGDDSAQFKAFNALLEKKSAEVRAKRRPEQAAKLVRLLAEDPATFAQSIVISNSEHSVYYDIPILADVDPIEFVKNFESSGGLGVRMIGVAFRERYQTSRLQALMPERAWLAKVAEMLRATARLRPGSVSAYRANVVADEMIKASKMMREAAKAQRPKKRAAKAVAKTGAA